jgi:hypothetical protein
MTSKKKSVICGEGKEKGEKGNEGGKFKKK